MKNYIAVCAIAILLLLTVSVSGVDKHLKSLQVQQVQEAALKQYIYYGSVPAQNPIPIYDVEYIFISHTKLPEVAIK